MARCLILNYQLKHVYKTSDLYENPFKIKDSLGGASKRLTVLAEMEIKILH